MTLHGRSASFDLRFYPNRLRKGTLLGSGRQSPHEVYRLSCRGGTTAYASAPVTRGRLQETGSKPNTAASIETKGNASATSIPASGSSAGGLERAGRSPEPLAVPNLQKAASPERKTVAPAKATIAVVTPEPVARTVASVTAGTRAADRAPAYTSLETTESPGHRTPRPEPPRQTPPREKTASTNRSKSIVASTLTPRKDLTDDSMRRRRGDHDELCETR